LAGFLQPVVAEISVRGGSVQALLGMAVVLVLSGAPAGAVIVAPGDGTGNTSAPPKDPGFAQVGVRDGLSAVYIGDGWILTANHVGLGDVEIEGVTYRAVPGSGVRLLTGGVQPADLLLFQIESDPGLPFLPIAMRPPAGKIVMIGNGRNRGAATRWLGIDGWLWGAGRTMRWGTNAVKNVSVDLSLGGDTVVFTTDFSEFGGTMHECQVATGDSGGAVFSKNGGVWELTGIQLTRAAYTGQPADTALFGNESWSAQLSDYRDQILDIVAEKACNNGDDDDGDGLVDYPDDPGCLDLDDAFERADSLPCDDGFDNDGDGRIDFDPVTHANPGSGTTLPAGEGDPGCGDPTWSTESPQCQDGIHNDQDGKMDYDAGLSIHGSADPAGADSHCVGQPWVMTECGLGAELAFLLPLVMWMRRHRR
jgi:hypothetical protein